MKNVWSWQQAVLGSTLQSSTKLVLLTLSTYMNARGDAVYPSQERLAAETSLTERSVITHITLAITAGFLGKNKRRIAGKQWDANEYYPVFPDGVQIIHPMASRGEINDKDGVNLFQTNYPDELSNKKDTNVSKKISSIEYAQFGEFWKLFPKTRAGSKEKAIAAFNRAVDREGLAQPIIEGVKAYAQSEEVARGYAKGAAAWLNDDRWTSDYGQGHTPSPTPPLAPIDEARAKRIAQEEAMG